MHETAMVMKRKLAQVVHWHSRWRSGLYNFALMGFFYQVYHLREDWFKKEEALKPTSYIEDLSNLQRIVGISLSLLLASKLLAPTRYWKRVSDSLTAMGLVEIFIFAWLYSKSKWEHVPLSSAYYFTVMAQEMYMDSERETVVTAYRTMMDLLAKSVKREEAAAAPLETKNSAPVPAAEKEE